MLQHASSLSFSRNVGWRSERRSEILRPRYTDFLPFSLLIDSSLFSHSRCVHGVCRHCDCLFGATLWRLHSRHWLSQLPRGVLCDSLLPSGRLARCVSVFFFFYPIDWVFFVCCGKDWIDWSFHSIFFFFWSGRLVKGVFLLTYFVLCVVWKFYSLLGIWITVVACLSLFGLYLAALAYTSRAVWAMGRGREKQLPGLFGITWKRFNTPAVCVDSNAERLSNFERFFLVFCSVLFCSVLFFLLIFY